MTTTREPAAIVGAIVAVVTAALALLVSFGLGLTAEQQAAILGFTAVVVPLVAGLLIRPQVTPLSDPVDEDGRVLVTAETFEDGDGRHRDAGYSLVEVCLAVLIVVVILVVLTQYL